jgi:putative hydrolase
MLLGDLKGLIEATPRIDSYSVETSINQQVARKLLEAADLLEQQQANAFRVNAYRRAADTVLSLKTDVLDIVEKNGLHGLVALPNIGEGIARAIYEMTTTGRWTQLERLRGTLEPIKLFQTLPGIGPELAQRVHDTLSVDSLEALEAAAHDGRLERVSGIGSRRTAIIRAVLAAMLSRRLRGLAGRRKEQIPIAILLDVDREYREKSEAGHLPTIAPKRFNPAGEAWLPILHTQRGDRHFTVLYSNTARAHELGRSRDWVVIYSYDDHHREGQATVVTETRGSLVGKRIVRGREAECRAYYEGSY